ncbi:MAG: site-specific integrase [Prevotella sp.]|nr:site-specific integrase [Prevotella sp.]
MLTIQIKLTKQQISELLDNPELILYFDNGKDADETSGRSLSTNTSYSFFAFFQLQIKQLKNNGNLRTSETYRTTCRRFMEFREGIDLSPADISPGLMEGFQAWLRKRQVSMNTISFYMRILRAVYNRAVEQELTADTRPFRNVYTGIAKTNKRALELNDLQRLKRVELDDAELQFARDLFLFSIMTRGMAFVDLALLKKEDIRNGVLNYKRHKTGQLIQVRWEPSMQSFVNQYPSMTHTYLLPIIHSENGHERSQYRHIQNKINKHLKEVAKRAGIRQKLTFYCARHSWATLAKNLNIPIEVISRGMGHSNEHTTEIYLKSIDVAAIDEANRKIINMLEDTTSY